MNVLDVSSVVEATNTSVNVDKKTLENLPKNAHRKNLRIYIKYTLCPYFWLLHYHVKEAIENKVKEMTQEGLIHYFWMSKCGIIKIRESAGLTVSCDTWKWRCFRTSSKTLWYVREYTSFFTVSFVCLLLLLSRCRENFRSA